MQAWLRPMLLLSLVLHGLLFFVPFGSSEPEAPAEPEEETVTLTQLPPADQPVAQPSPSPRATPAPRPRPSVLPRARVNAPPARRNAPPPVRSNRQEPVAAAPTTPVAPTAPPANDFLRDFPRYPGARTGTVGLPPAFASQGQNTSDAIRAVDSWFERELAAKGYTAAAFESEANRVVYEVSRQGTTQYLTLLSNPTDVGTNILITPQPLPADLGSVSVEPPEVAQFFTELPIPDIDADNPNPAFERVSEPGLLLSQPNAFFASLGSDEGGFYIEPELRSEVRRAVVALGQTDPQALFTNELQNLLEIGAYEIAPQGNYGGGLLYQLQRDGVTGYISLVPATNGRDTVIFVWEKPPQ
ncbi:hypothetical protein H6G89_26235 [Oscillatoria sp. FACHB-1407]|uniref:hypothetical protein n=1 Tax=Oscillatoria sp. FACHB-1407 TaxID=2692847 RepID=UPI00168597FF|nr:hypothetical protein [Oscillatoria sp. FACHB-1407]MBD2464509.1 hypothetical protein [Oscillatoria sp. FACHB-1407]